MKCMKFGGASLFQPIKNLRLVNGVKGIQMSTIKFLKLFTHWKSISSIFIIFKHCLPMQKYKENLDGKIWEVLKEPRILEKIAPRWCHLKPCCHFSSSCCNFKLQKSTFWKKGPRWHRMSWCNFSLFWKSFCAQKRAHHF